MKKPLIIMRRQKRIAAIILSAVVLLIGLIIVYETKNGDDGIAVFNKQDGISSSNNTIEDLLARIMEE